MKTLLRKRALIVIVFLACVSALSGGIWRYGYVQALAQLQSRGEADLRLASDRLTRNLQRFQELAVLLADHPALKLAHEGRPEDARRLLLGAADKTSARNLLYADRSGAVLASAQNDVPEALGQSVYFRRAMHGALGAHHDVTDPGQQRSYYFAAPSFGADGKVRGAVIVVIDVDAIEFEWRGGTPAVFFTDDAGDVFVSNRTELLLWSVKDGAFRNTQGQVQPKSEVRTAGYEVWRMDWGPYLPRRALHLVLPLPVIGLVGEALIDVAPALRLAGLQAMVFGALCLAAGALLMVFAERRRALAMANAKLEARVLARTADLRRAVSQLKREVTERQEAQAALTRAQADLVQAGKLSALGQMSAGISHELNQPLMAIRSYAENSTLFLERGQTDVTAENLTRISELARRMGRIIRNLRAFARNESEAMTDVDLVSIIEGALDLNAARRADESVALDWQPPDAPVYVRGGEVRLGQVLLNLITNACDAMAEQDRRALTLRLERNQERVTLQVADTGPGIEAPDKIFDPFYTTKAVGEAKGMGLGLSISYGLVQSFGGAISGANGPEGGAVFTLELDAAGEEQAA